MVERGAHVFDQWGYMAGRDLDRLDDLNAAFVKRAGALDNLAGLALGPFSGFMTMKIVAGLWWMSLKIIWNPWASLSWAASKSDTMASVLTADRTRPASS
jgi:hypothetical protein